MGNILKEILDCLDENNKKESDILWVGSEDIQCDWENFKLVAAKADYDNNGLGLWGVAQDIYIVGDDWWINLVITDHGEFWDFTEFPKKLDKFSDITCVTLQQLAEYDKDKAASLVFPKLKDLNI